MISCIICSRTPDISFEQRNNINETIGVNHEIVVIDNSFNTYSIFSAYNEGVKRAIGDIACFMHDDILFETQGWGRVIQALINSEKIGVVGVAGTYCIPDFPCYWSNSHISTGRIKWDGELWDEPNISGSCSVIALDGVFLCIKADLFRNMLISFDEKTFNGFHYYDMDICMQIHNAGYEAIVTRDIIMNHFHHAIYNKNFFENQKIFYNKWKQNLPMVKGITVDEAITLLAQGQLNALNRLDNLVHSRAYRIGNYILHPKLLLERIIQGKSFSIVKKNYNSKHQS